MPGPISIAQASSLVDYAAGKALIEEYAAALGVDLCFQNFAEELAALPEVYGPPRGCLLLARMEGTPVGCIGVREHAAGTCEMKRLYVQPQTRGTGLGRRMVEAAVRHARHLGYARMLLDTLPQMHAAQSLYASLGFREIDGYYPNPLSGVRYMALELAARTHD